MRRALWTIAAAMLLGPVAALAVPVATTDYRIDLPGTTMAANPALKGVVIADMLTPYSATDPATGNTIAGNIQSRVVRRDSNGTLDFYWRIMPGPGGNVAPFLFTIEDFFAANDPIDIDYRSDGLGAYGPWNAKWYQPFGILEFIFNTGCTGVVLCPPNLDGSRFFFVATSARSFRQTGRMMLIASPTIKAGFLPTYAPAMRTRAPKPNIRMVRPVAPLTPPARK